MTFARTAQRVAATAISSLTVGRFFVDNNFSLADWLDCSLLAFHLVGIGGKTSTPVAAFTDIRFYEVIHGENFLLLA
jgi:hypothetical protein